jgi:AcrR family transcriptional regulator
MAIVAPPRPLMRADARRNRQLLLDATIELVLEVGGEPSRDAVAERAGVGIATLYRHFPDQQALLRAAAIEVLDRVIEEGRAALDAAATGGEALRRYLHAAIDSGLGAVNILYPLLDDHDWPEQREAARDLLDRLVDAAVRDRSIPSDCTATDLALAAIRFCRPLAVGLDPAAERAIAHRQLEHYLDGLAASTEATQPVASGAPASDNGNNPIEEV